MSRSQPDETVKAKGPLRKTRQEKNRDLPSEMGPLVVCLQEGCLVAWPAVFIQTANQSFWFQSCSPLPTLCVPGVSKPGAFLVPKGQIVPFLAASPTYDILEGWSLCSFTSVPPLQLLCIARGFGNMSFTDGLSLPLSLGFLLSALPLSF